MFERIDVLISTLSEMQKEYSNILRKIESRLKWARKLKDNPLAERCPKCSFSEYDGERVQFCPYCKDTGLIAPYTCECGETIGLELLELRRTPVSECPYCGEKIEWVGL